MLFLVAFAAMAINPPGFATPRQLVFADAPDDAIVQTTDQTLPMGNWTMGVTTPLSTNDAYGVTVMQNGTADAAVIYITNLLANTQYFICMTVDASSGAGYTGNPRIVATNDTGCNFGNQNGTLFNLPVGLFTNYVTNIWTAYGTTSPHKLVIKHATSADGNWFRISRFTLYPIPNRSSANIAFRGDLTSGYVAASANTIDIAVTNAPDAIANVVMPGDLAETANPNYTTLNGNVKGAMTGRGGNLYAAAGNHDYDSISSFLTFFGLTQTYRKVTLGRVDFFLYDTNAENTDGSRTTLASCQGSVMGRWLISQVQQSTNVWKVVVLHHPAWSSSSLHSPASNVEYQWNFRDLGVHAVLQGHDHVMERITQGGVPVFTCGLGGSTTAAFGTLIEGSKFQGTRNGFIKVWDAPDSLTFELYDTNRFLLDRSKVVKR